MKRLKLEHIHKDDLIVGEPVKRAIYSREGKLLLRKGFVIETERQRERLLQQGVCHNFHEVPSQPDELIIQPSASVIKTLDEIQNTLTCVFKKFKEGNRSSLMVEILNISKTIFEACARDGDASLGSILISRGASYTVSHPVHVAILCGLIGKKMKWTDNDLLSLLAAALTCNISKIDLQEALYYQKDPLTDEQKQQVRQHPEKTVEMLRKAGVFNDLWLKSVLCHHETMDGTGYPHGLKSYSVPLSSRIIAACDIFCAAVTGRAYRYPLSPDDAVRKIFLSADKTLDMKIANMFVALIGVYPPGSFVTLANGEIAIVAHRGRKAHQPIVFSIIDGNGRRLQVPVLRDCSDSAFAITGTLHRGQVWTDIDPALIWVRDRNRVKNLVVGSATADTLRTKK